MSIQEAKTMLRQLGGAQLKLPNNINMVAALKAENRDRCQALLDAAQKAERDFTPAEKAEYDACIEVMKSCSARMEDVALRGGPTFGSRPFSPHQLIGIPTNPDDGAAPEGLSAVHDWMRGKIEATSTPLHVYQSPVSPGLAAAIPTSVLDAMRSYFLNDPFRLAGSTIYNTEDTQPLVKPIISAGSDADSFVEGQSATDSKPFQADSFTFGGTKYSRLVKVSEEALMNVLMDLPGEILAELTASVANTFTGAITTALTLALQSNSSCLVSFGADHYEACLNLLGAVPPRFETDTNCFMGSRAMLKSIRNTRASGSGDPLFDPTTGLVMNRRFIINDNLTRLVYGNWAAGAFVRKSPFFLQRLIEAYHTEGAIGFKATQYLDSKFLASVSAVTTQPLYFTHLDVAGS
jgi:HK97 family phage major capsid protein